MKRFTRSGGAAPPLALALCLILAACGGASAPASSTPPTAPARAPAEPSAAAPALASVAASPASKQGAAAPEAPGPSAAKSAAAPTGPAAVAGRWFDLVNRGDTSGVATLFTGDAVYIGGPPCEVQTFCKGPAAIARGVESYAASRTTLTPVGTPQVAGNLVFLRFEVRNDAKVVGVERELIVVNAVVLGDKLAAFVGQPDLSDAQTVTSRLHRQAQASAPSSAPAGETDPTAVIQRFMDALNRGDPNAWAGTFADNAVNITPNPACGLRTPCTSLAAVSKAEQVGIATHQQVTRVGDWRLAGDLVQVVNEARSDTIRAMGVDRVRAIVTWQVVGDRTLTRVNLQDLSDPETVKRQLLQQAQASAPGAAGPPASATAGTRP
jgi:ketosteroid isomerase-like protein